MPRGEQNRAHDEQTTWNQWLEDNGFQPEETSQNEAVVNNRIRQEEIERRRLRRERIRAREGNQPAIRQSQIEAQRSRAAEWARSQGFITDEPSVAEDNTSGGKIKQTQKTK